MFAKTKTPQNFIKRLLGLYKLLSTCSVRREEPIVLLRADDVISEAGTGDKYVIYVVHNQCW